MRLRGELTGAFVGRPSGTIAPPASRVNKRNAGPGSPNPAVATLRSACGAAIFAARGGERGMSDDGRVAYFRGSEDTAQTAVFGN